MKLEKKVLTMTTTVIGTAENTYEVIREIGGMEGGEEVYIIQLYPTVSIGNPERVDSTAQRHTYASLAVSGGTDIKCVQELLGHADAATTLNVYANSYTEKKVECVNRMEQMIYGQGSLNKISGL